MGEQAQGGAQRMKESAQEFTNPNSGQLAAGPDSPAAHLPSSTSCASFLIKWSTCDQMHPCICIPPHQSLRKLGACRHAWGPHVLHCSSLTAGCSQDMAARAQLASVSRSLAVRRLARTPPADTGARTPLARTPLVGLEARTPQAATMMAKLPTSSAPLEVRAACLCSFH